MNLDFLNDRKRVALMAAAVVILALILVFGFRGTAPQPGGGEQQAGEQPSRPVTREPVPEGVVVPEIGALEVPENVAVPRFVSAASLTSDASYRSFVISIEGGQFKPDTIAVRERDIVDLNITAIDQDYDFTQPDFGFRQPIPQGTTEKVQFAAGATGKFTFFCASCGGPDQGPKGFILIVPK